MENLRSRRGGKGRLFKKLYSLSGGGDKSNRKDQKNQSLGYGVLAIPCELVFKKKGTEEKTSEKKAIGVRLRSVMDRRTVAETIWKASEGNLNACCAKKGRDKEMQELRKTQEGQNARKIEGFLS